MSWKERKQAQKPLGIFNVSDIIAGQGIDSLFVLPYGLAQLTLYYVNRFLIWVSYTFAEGLLNNALLELE